MVRVTTENQIHVMASEPLTIEQATEHAATTARDRRVVLLGVSSWTTEVSNGVGEIVAYETEWTFSFGVPGR